MDTNPVFQSLKGNSQSDQDMFFISFSLTFKAFVTFLLLQSNLHIVLACGKGPKSSPHQDLSITKNRKQKIPGTQLSLDPWLGFQPN